MQTQTLLKFGFNNAKLKNGIHTFSLPSGYTCPGAEKCLTKFDRKTRKMVDGPKSEFRCFAASSEMYPNVSSKVDHNFALLKGKTEQEMATLLLDSLPIDATIVRVHVGGDFFSQAYFNAWVVVATENPQIKFYAYTKSLPYWIHSRLSIPSNLMLTASEGGKFDHLISVYGFRTSKVVYTLEAAAALGLEVDHDDSHAYTEGPSFALLIHGTQAKGTAAAEAKKALKGVGSYGKGQ